MPNKIAVMVYLGDYYAEYTRFQSLQFAYKNVCELSCHLKENGWTIYPPISNELATSEYCIAYLKEKISLLQSDDWLLFYFVGHGDTYISSDPFDNYPVYIVTSIAGTTNDPNNPTSYFLDSYYSEIVSAFQQKVPNGHLITILDCCYAYGFINQPTTESSFHTVFAAANGDAKAAYKDNSFFFQSLKKYYSARTFEQMKPLITRSMREDYPGHIYVNMCKIQLADNFKQTTF